MGNAEAVVSVFSSIIGLALAAFFSYYIFSRILFKKEKQIVKGNFSSFLIQFNSIKDLVDSIKQSLQLIIDSLESNKAEEITKQKNALLRINKRFEQLNEEKIPINAYKPFLQLKQEFKECLNSVEKHYTLIEKNDKNRIALAKVLKKHINEISSAFSKIEEFANKVQK